MMANKHAQNSRKSTAKTASRKRKIAILGGGVGGIAAAYGITSKPGWKDEIESITVYQMGWRLGGKGASGRNSHKRDRIEEHGLHIWMGCYDNAFAMMQQCYAICDTEGLTPHTPFPNWDDAFKKHNLVTLTEEIDGQCLLWSNRFPPNREIPGDPSAVLTPWDFVRKLVDWLVDRFEDVLRDTFGRPLGMIPLDRAPIPRWLQETLADKQIVSRVAQRTATNANTAAKTPLHWAVKLLKRLPADARMVSALEMEAIVALLGQFLEDFWRTFERDINVNDTLRRLWILQDLVITSIRGMSRSGVLFSGFDPLDALDLREFLLAYGARPSSVWSAPVKALYDLAFAYEGGNSNSPNMGAGVGLRTIWRLCWTYKGAFCWKMQASMGDIVFTPLYKTLEHRGVKFKFFHRVKNLRLSADSRRVESIELAVQANVMGGSYQPIRDIGGLLCWPDRPDFSQLAEGNILQQRGIDLESAWADWTDPAQAILRYGVDFDVVILAIPIGALPYVAPELIAAQSAWRNMIAHVKTTQTQAIQLWLTRDSRQLGWSEPEPALIAAHFRSSADMSQVLRREGWQANDHVRHTAYFCSELQDATWIPHPYTDPTFPAREAARVKNLSLEFLRENIRPFWPLATSSTNPEGLDWDWLVDLTGQTGEARFDDQLWKANINPSDRYVLSVKGSTRYRLAPDRSGFDNLYLAGDWTLNGYNAGCVEGAVVSGLMASRAICGHPQEIFGESDL